MQKILYSYRRVFPRKPAYLSVLADKWSSRNLAQMSAGGGIRGLHRLDAVRLGGSACSSVERLSVQRRKLSRQVNVVLHCSEIAGATRGRPSAIVDRFRSQASPLVKT